jgi:hypothetical protein
MILEDKIKQSTMGEVAYNEAWLKHIKLQHDVSVAELEWEEAVISTQLLQMPKGGGMSFWPKPILHPNRPQGDDPSMIITNKHGLCG